MSDVTAAVRILRAGGLVAFPTETVYGLGADGTNSAAVRKIFEAKGRPSTNPLIAHVANEATARRYAATWPLSAETLARRFWPGPLTLVVPKQPSIADEATAGRPTVAMRSPDHPLALRLLREFDGPIAAPSANRSTHVSPTTAQHVREELGDRIDRILDGGPSRVGIESTVLDLSGAVPRILRPGAITRQQIEAEIGPVQVFAGSVSPEAPADSPGQHAIHYAPRTPAYRFTRDQAKSAARWLRKHAEEKMAGILIGDIPPEFAKLPLRPLFHLPDDHEQYAHRLYGTLREADQSRATVILVEMPPDEPCWTAVRDRLSRATSIIPLK